MKNSRVNILGLTLVLVLSLSVITGCWWPLESRTHKWENRCKLTLRALGSCQLAFADTNNREFGTWDELLKADFIQQGYDQLNIIDNYRIVVFDVQKSIKDKDGKIISPPGFAVVAVPNDINYGLRTFAIGTEQTPKLWIGDSKEFDITRIDLKNKSQWEPLR